ncbi:MAG: hypothetical protein QNJ81_00790 [Acidimicrobiia bacterium]|nr:hypothetical protein [Acidimicrobiia bacterium]
MLGATADALTFIALGAWRIADFEVVATIPFSKIASIEAESKFRRQSLTITLQNGHSMQLDTSQWNDLVPGLPHELLNTAAMPPT